MKFEASSIESNTPSIEEARHEIPPEIVATIERRERTNELEARLEQDKEECLSKERGFAAGIIDNLKKRGANALRITLLAAILGIGNSNETGSADAQEITPNVDAFRRTEQAQMPERTRMDLTAIAESAGFNVRVEVPSPSGRYIAHIGQLHRTPGIEQKVERSHQIADIQRDIETLLLALTKNGITNVFTEGYAEDPGFSFMDTFNKDTWEKARKIQAGLGCFDELAEKCKEEIRFYDEDRIGSSLVLTKKHIFQQRAIEIRQELEKNGNFSELDRISFESCLASFKPTGALEKLGDDAIYFMGANEKLQEEGVIKIIPAETKEGNEGAFKYELELNKASAEYFNADIMHMPLEKTLQLRDKYDSLKKLDERATFDDREDIALAKMARYAKTHPEDAIIPIVFGDAHDFRDNIETLNATNEIKFGLIRFTPLKDEKGLESLRKRK